MEFNVGFLGLIVSGLMLFSEGCRNAKQEELLIYMGYDRSTNEVFDTLTVICKEETCMLLENDFFNPGSFVMSSSKAGEILYGAIECPTSTILPLKKGESVDNSCIPIPPFVGEQITILDMKSLSVRGQEFEVYKIYNDVGDSHAENSAIYWVEDIGIIYIGISGGRYYELKEKGKSSAIVDAILLALKSEIDFSERWPIPPPPPPPDILIDE